MTEEIVNSNNYMQIDCSVSQKHVAKLTNIFTTV